MIIEYRILRASEAYELNTLVRELISEGWVPQGGVAYSGSGGKCNVPGGWAQAMIKETT